MLYRFIISNYKSFAENMQFDMFPNMKRENFSNHIYSNGPLPVLKGCAIYGANGAGKSNFIKAISFLKKFVTIINFDENKNWIKSWYLNNRYKLPVIDETLPISFIIEFGIKDKVYLYEVKIDAQGINTEKLYLSSIGKGDNIPIFERKGINVEFKTTLIKDDVTKIFERQFNDNPSVSVLALNGSLHLSEDKNMMNAFEWFRNGLDVIEVSRQIPWLIDYLKKQPKMMEFVNSIFKEINLGINNLQIKDDNFDNWLENAEKKDRDIMNQIFRNDDPKEFRKSISKMDHDVPLLTITGDEGKRMVSEFIFNQIGKENYTGDMDVTTQSNGTLRLLTLIPALYNAILKDKTIIVDEIDNGIHPMLMKKLVKYFGDSQSKGQLIYTTHETCLLNQSELLRPDEVWFAEKAEGSTKMYSLNDFKIHKTLSIENGYLEGRFGAIPFIGTLE
jgi:AAA15 family ATPase/GTPase